MTEPTGTQESYAGTLRNMLREPVLARHFDDSALIAAMVRFEVSLAQAQAACGVIPPAAAACIANVCTNARFDTIDLAERARVAGTLAIPFVKALTAQVANVDNEAARYVHWGATSQDVIDTATVLCARSALLALDGLVQLLGNGLAALARTHRDTVMSGRTLLQAAIPISFGWKAASWLAPLMRSRDALAQVRNEQLVLQFGGASGTLAALGDRGMAVSSALSAALQLPAPAISWHAARDRFARVGNELAILTGVVGKIARDVSLLMQTEVAEAFEPVAPGRGGSSAMPHKRNPVGCMLALEAALRAPGLAGALLSELPAEHERGLGHWQNSFFVLADLFDAAGSATAAMAEVIMGLRVDEAAMLANLDRSGGFVFAEAASVALAGQLGKSQAGALVETICAQALAAGQTFQQALAAHPEVARLLDAQALACVLDPGSQLQSAHAMIDAVLASWSASLPSP